MEMRLSEHRLRRQTIREWKDDDQSGNLLYSASHTRDFIHYLYSSLMIAVRLHLAESRRQSGNLHLAIKLALSNRQEFYFPVKQSGRMWRAGRTIHIRIALSLIALPLFSLRSTRSTQSSPHPHNAVVCICEGATESLRQRRERLH